MAKGGALPAIGSSPYATTQGAGSGIVAPRARVDLKRVEQVVNEDEQVRQSLVKLQKELSKMKTSVAVQRRLAKNKADGAQVRTEYDSLVGKDLNAKLASVSPASEEQQVIYSTMLNQRLHAIGQDLWMRMFKIADADNSGRISFHEFSLLIRKYLRVPASALSEEDLQGLWRALDEDSSGYISCGEFGKFMRKGGGKRGRGKGKSAAAAQRYFARLEAQRAKVANDEAIEMQYAVDQVAEHAKAAETRRKQMERELARVKQESEKLAEQMR